MHRLIYPCLLGVLMLPQFALANSIRTWTDQQGRELEAEFIRVYNGDVIFKKHGKILRVPLANLSPADQAIAMAGGEEPELRPESAAAAAGSLRIWVDQQGNKISAQFVRYEAGQVVLASGGEERSFPLEEFSANDQQYVQQQAGIDLLPGEETPAEADREQLAQSQPNESRESPTRSSPTARFAANSSAGGAGNSRGSAPNPMHRHQPRDNRITSHEPLSLASRRARQMVTETPDYGEAAISSSAIEDMSDSYRPESPLQEPSTKSYSADDYVHPSSNGDKDQTSKTVLGWARIAKGVAMLLLLLGGGGAAASRRR